MAGLDGVMTVMKVEDIYHHQCKNNALVGGDEKDGGGRSSVMSNLTTEATVITRDAGGGLPQETKAEAHAPKYQPIQAKKLGPIVALTSGRIFHGSEKDQVLACTVDGWLHIFDFQCDKESEGFRGMCEVAPMFTIEIPNNVFAVRVLDSVMVGSPSPIIILVTNETDKGPIAKGFVHFLYLQFKEAEAAEPDSSFSPCLVPAVKYNMGGEIASLIVNPYPPLSSCNPEGEDLGRATSGVWTIAVGFEGGGIAVLSIRPSDPSVGEGVGGKLEVKPVPMKTGGGLPMSIWRWNGVAFVFGPFKRGEGFGVCTVDGRVAYIEVKVEQEEENCNNSINELPSQCDQDHNDEECCLNLADIDETVVVAGPLWSTRWCHQTRETFFHGGALPLGTTSTSTMQTLLHLNQSRGRDVMGNTTMSNEADLEPFAVCSWGGVTMICDAEGRTSPIYFDPRDFIESPIRAFSCGSITLRKGLDSRPALIYVTGAGEVVIYHSIWDEIGRLNSAEPSFEERIFRGGGLQNLRTLLRVALERLDKYEKLELSQPQWKEDGELTKSTSSPLPQKWKDLAALSRFLLERGTSSQTMDVSGPPFVSAMRESITPILNEIESCSGDGCYPSLYSKPNLQKVLNRLALASRAEKLNM